jgi:hypothetical protein
MRFALAIFCMFAWGPSAFAQYGVSNARDGYGNLVRNNGTNPLRSSPQTPIPQTPSNNPNGPISNVPRPVPATNPASGR